MDGEPPGARSASPADGPLPTFFVLGAEKAGTTTLHSQLGVHPDVLVSDPKEPHVFDRHYENGLDQYAQTVFSHHDDEAIRGEATPTYLNLPFVAERIANHLPDAKHVVVLRDPVERAYSSWWMFRVRRLEHLSFEEAIARNQEELEQGIGRFDGPDGAEAWDAYVDAIREGHELLFRTYLQGGWYDENLTHYLKRFPEDQLKVLLADDLYTHHKATLEEIWAFLGASSPYPNVEPSVKNPALGRYIGPVVRLAQVTGLIRIVPHLPESWRMGIKHATSWMGDRPPMSQEAGEHLGELFRPHNQALAKITGLDLSGWWGMDR